MASLVTSSRRFAISRALLPNGEEEAIQPTSADVASSTVGDDVADASSVSTVAISTASGSANASVAIKAV